MTFFNSPLKNIREMPRPHRKMTNSQYISGLDKQLVLLRRGQDKSNCDVQASFAHSKVQPNFLLNEKEISAYDVPIKLKRTEITVYRKGYPLACVTESKLFSWLDNTKK